MQPQGLIKIRLLSGILLTVAIVGYSLYATWNYLGGPELVIEFPRDGYSTTSPTTPIYGLTKHANFLSLNDRAIYVDEEGEFRETLLLSPGYNIIKLYTKDRYNRDITKIIYINRNQ